MLVKGLEQEQIHVRKELELCRMQFKQLEGLRLDQI